MSQSIQLPWGNEQIEVNLPDEWTILGKFEPASLAPVADAQAEAERSLREPVGTPRLADLVKPGMKIVLVVDDSSRPTPVNLIIPALLAELGQAGVSLGDLTVVPAIGLHRPMPEEEIRQRLGIDASQPLRFVNPECDNPDSMRLLGTTRFKTPVWINRVVCDADLVISIGCIEPHIIASFGGGYKNIIPGTAGRETIAHNHTLNCAPSTFNMVGQPIENNPMRQDLEEGAEMLKPPVWIINAILNNLQQVVRIVSGDPIQAHRAGVKVSADLYGVDIPEPADIVISSSHPMDQDLRQGVKSLANTVRALKPGGVMINLVRAEEGVGVFGLANMKLPLDRNGFQILAPVILPLVPKLKIKGLGEEDRFFLYFALQAMRRGKIFMYAPTIPLEVQNNLPFVQFEPTVAETITAARKRFPHKAKVILFPGGGITYPKLP